MIFFFTKIKKFLTLVHKEKNVCPPFCGPGEKSTRLSEPALRTMIILSLALHCFVLAIFFFIQGLQHRLLLNPCSDATVVCMINPNDLPGSGGGNSASPLTPEQKKEEMPNILTQSLSPQKKSAVKQRQRSEATQKKLGDPPPPDNSMSLPAELAKAEPVESSQAGSATQPLPVSENADGLDAGCENGEGMNTKNNTLLGTRGHGEGVGAGENRGGGNSAQGVYLAMVRSKIEKHKAYPRLASIRQIQGTVIIHFIITLEGTVKGLEVAQSSGSLALDQAGLSAVKTASPFPKPPFEIFKTEVVLEVPIVFELI